MKLSLFVILVVLTMLRAKESMASEISVINDVNFGDFGRKDKVVNFTCGDQVFWRSPDSDPKDSNNLQCRL